MYRSIPRHFTSTLCLIFIQNGCTVFIQSLPMVLNHTQHPKNTEGDNVNRNTVLYSMFHQILLLKYHPFYLQLYTIRDFL